MSVEENKEIARRFIEEVWNEGRLEVADELLATNAINHDWPPGQTQDAAGFKRFIADYRARNPEIRFTIEDMFGEGDQVATRVTIRGVGAIWTGIGIIRVENGRIAEQWADTTRIA